MDRPELMPFNELEFHPFEGVRIVLEPELEDVIDRVGFSETDFYEWTAKQGLQDASQHPLTINIKAVSPKNYNGTFYVKDGDLTIDLFVLNRINTYLAIDEFEFEDREAAINSDVNDTLTHEIEHYIETANGAVLLDIRAELIIKNIINMALERSDDERITDDEIISDIERTVELIDSQDTHQLYLDQPHEIRARAARDKYPTEQGCMLWLSLKR